MAEVFLIGLNVNVQNADLPSNVIFKFIIQYIY